VLLSGPGSVTNQKHRKRRRKRRERGKLYIYISVFRNVGIKLLETEDEKV
jgi:hypothetical protein